MIETVKKIGVGANEAVRMIDDLLSFPVMLTAVI